MWRKYKNNKMKKLTTVLIAMTFFFISKGNAQEIYRTQNGIMVITAESADSIITLTTKKLLVLLNYDDAKFEMKMDKSDFYTGNEALDKKLRLMKYEIIEYGGKLDLDYINTKGHPPLNFNVEGVLSTNNKFFRGTGHLEHIANNGLYSCLLTLKFYIKVDDLGLRFDELNLEEDIQIEIVQSVLNKIEDY